VVIRGEDYVRALLCDLRDRTSDSSAIVWIEEFL
jgi:hypothetical protein